ncbi:MAG: hypothetical protein ACTSRP_28145 [Candidatus Helarchaeota archaeon]
MNLRIFFKSFKLAIRARRRFILFVAIYALLIAFTTVFANYAYKTGNGWGVLGSIGSTVITSVIYGLILSGYRKTQVATLRCLGWDFSNIQTLFIGELILVTIVAFFIDLEIAIHQIGIVYYFLGEQGIQQLGEPLFQPLWFFLTFFITLAIQCIGIYVAYYKMKKIKPMEALRKV